MVVTQFHGKGKVRPVTVRSRPRSVDSDPRRRRSNVNPDVVGRGSPGYVDQRLVPASGCAVGCCFLSVFTSNRTSFAPQPAAAKRLAGGFCANAGQAKSRTTTTGVTFSMLELLSVQCPQYFSRYLDRKRKTPTTFRCDEPSETTQQSTPSRFAPNFSSPYTLKFRHCPLTALSELSPWPPTNSSLPTRLPLSPMRNPSASAGPARITSKA